MIVSPQERIAVYTSIFGDYDDLKPPPEVPGVDFFCFTDDSEIDPAGWMLRTVRRRHTHPRLAAKWYKLFNDRALPEYRYTLYLDGSIRLKSPEAVHRLFSYLGKGGLALFSHPDRDNIYEEAEVSLGMSKYQGARIREQVETYRRRGLPTAHGLFAGGVLVRDRDARSIHRLARRWWKENIRWTYQDQLSLPFVLWKLRIEPDIIPLNLWANPLFEVEISRRRHEGR